MAAVVVVNRMINDSDSENEKKKKRQHRKKLIKITINFY